MSKFEGYSVSDVIHAGGVSTVYRAVRQSDGERVILKWLSASNPTLGDLARYRLAYDTMRGLQIPGVSEVLALEDHDRRPLLVSRDIGGITLAEWLSRGPLPLRDALATALGVADALARLHDHGIVHRDVNPSNIVVVPSTGQVELIDFDLATRLRVERIEARSAQSLNGTLAYISPEQTGRMNRTVDHRTDLYSLGATLYEMLAGVVPFAETDSAALIHAHLAVQPKPLHLVAGLVPDVVAAITMRLLAKAPEDRYRGAPGLRADLARCLEALRNDAPLTPFPLATKDVSPRLRVSQRLYGREVETDTLLGAFGRASRDGAELVLVDGPSGVGKSALIRELYRPIAARRGRFVWGKYDKLNAAPYAALADALSELVRDILAEPEHEIARWRTVLLEALEGAASVMVELVPNLGLVLGPQPVAPALGPSGAQNRFQRTIMRFIQAFARPEHPLALFVDDLQWADGPTIELLRLLLGDSRTRHLLVVAAWRSGEVDAAHPLYAALETLERETPRVTRLCLSPLSLPDVQSLVADTLSLPVDDAAPLAAAMFAKTAGNPFFLERFLGSLAEDGLLRFEVTRGRWEWDLARIAGREVADNVGELLARKLAALDEGTRDVLRLAACIGSQFDLTTLSVIAGRTPSELAALLWPAVEEDLVDPQGMAYRVLPVLGADDAAALGGDPSVVYRFIHDRIHEAAYALVDAGERAALHLQIGRLLLADRKPEEIGEPLFDVTNHLNRGLALLTGEADRVALARLNREAAARAVASAAYDTAARHAETGWELLPAGGWAAEPELAWELLRLKAQVAMMVGAFDRAAALHDALAEHAADVGRSVDVVLMRMVERMRASDSAGAIAHGLEGLKPFGFSEPADPDGWGALIGAEAAFVASYLAVHPVESLGSLRAAQDPSAIQQMRVLALMGSPAYTMPHVMAYLTCRIVRLSIEFGCTPDTPLGFVLFGVSSCMQGDMERGDAFGRLGPSAPRPARRRLGGRGAATAPVRDLHPPLAKSAVVHAAPHGAGAKRWAAVRQLRDRGLGRDERPVAGVRLGGAASGHARRARAQPRDRAGHHQARRHRPRADVDRAAGRAPHGPRRAPPQAGRGRADRAGAARAARALRADARRQSRAAAEDRLHP